MKEEVASFKNTEKRSIVFDVIVHSIVTVNKNSLWTTCVSKRYVLPALLSFPEVLHSTVKN